MISDCRKHTHLVWKLVLVLILVVVVQSKGRYSSLLSFFGRGEGQKGVGHARILNTFRKMLVVTVLYYFSVVRTIAKGLTPEERLITDLLANYTKEARPVKDPRDKIVVTFGFELVQLVNVVSSYTLTPTIQVTTILDYSNHWGDVNINGWQIIHFCDFAFAHLHTNLYYLYISHIATYSHSFSSFQG